MDSFWNLLPAGLQPLVVFLVGVVLLVETWWHGRAGWVGLGHGGRTLRAESPTGFWLLVGMKIAVALLAIWLGLRFR
ncbi:MAG TPA: hypothetical protein VF265_01495 [Nevskiaceae bacterium]